MKLHRFLVMVLLLAQFLIPATAQDAVPSGDLGSAQTLLETLTRENETLAADATRLQKEADLLTGQITAARKESSDLLPFLDEVKARSASIATLAEALVDRALKAQAWAAFAKNKATERRIKQRLDDLLAQVLDLTKQIEGKTNQVAVNQARVARNNDHMVLLQATVAKTRLQENQLRLLLDEIDALSAKADSTLPSGNR